MSKKISFSSVLKERKGFEQLVPQSYGFPSLSELAEQFVCNPHGNFTLRLAFPNKNSKIRTNTMNFNCQMDFQDGQNPLQQWINSQAQSSNFSTNKQNHFMNQQYSRKSSYQDLFKSKGTRSPKKMQIRNRTQKNGFNNKNLSMNELSKMYVERKSYGNQTQQREPVWKFASKQSESEYNKNNVCQINPVRAVCYNQSKECNDDYEQIRQSLANEQYQHNPKLNEAQNQYLQNHYENIKKEEINRVFSTQKPKISNISQGAKNLQDLVDKIKNNLANQIESMAQRIVQEHRSCQTNQQNQDLSFQQQKQKQGNSKIDLAKQQIQQYLKLKKEQPTQMKYESNRSNKFKESLPKSNQKCENSAVGYSFANEFNSKIQNKTELVPETKKEYNLPNIDEIKSQQDINQKYQAIKQSNNHLLIEQNQNASIDKQAIQEIQSIAYNKITQSAEDQKKHQQQQKYMPSIHEKVAKLSMSVSVDHQNEYSDTQAAVKNSIEPTLKNAIEGSTQQTKMDSSKQGQGFMKKQGTNAVIEASKISSNSISNTYKANSSYVKNITVETTPSGLSYQRVQFVKVQGSNDINCSGQQMHTKTVTETKKQENYCSINRQQQNIQENPSASIKIVKYSETYQSKGMIQRPQQSIQAKKTIKINMPSGYTEKPQQIHESQLGKNYSQQTQQQNQTKMSFKEQQNKKSIPQQNSINNANCSINKIKIHSYYNPSNSIKPQQSINQEIKNKQPLIKAQPKSSIRFISPKGSINGTKLSIKGPKESLNSDQFQFDLDF